MAPDFPDTWHLTPLEDCMEAIIDYRGKTPRKTAYKGHPPDKNRKGRQKRVALRLQMDLLNPREKKYDDWECAEACLRKGDVVVDPTEVHLWER